MPSECSIASTVVPMQHRLFVLHRDPFGQRSAAQQAARVVGFILGMDFPADDLAAGLSIQSIVS